MCLPCSTEIFRQDFWYTLHSYLIPLEIDREPFRLRGVRHPQIRVPVLEGEFEEFLPAIRVGLAGDETYLSPEVGITALGGKEHTWW